MLIYQDADIHRISFHIVGNPVNGGQLSLIDEPLKVLDVKLQEACMEYFLSSFKQEEVYRFFYPEDNRNLNPISLAIDKVFEEPDQFHHHSKRMAQYLYDMTQNGNVKEGELFVVHFKHLEWNGEEAEAIGLFKAETRTTILQLLKKEEEPWTFKMESGIAVDKLDKGCLAIKVPGEDQYHVLALDKTNKNEAQFWMDDYLKVLPEENAFLFTKNTMGMAKSFVMDKLPEVFEVEKTDQIDYLNQSANYFDSMPAYNEDEFAQQVFRQPEVIDSFRAYKGEFQAASSAPLADSFDLSPTAVKQQKRIFKSVLKLDKNFHIYIHGDRSLIEKGVDENGRKYYKVFYTEEQ